MAGEELLAARKGHAKREFINPYMMFAEYFM